jgi:DNA-directed RNA polymerase specialized sigma24 family protein
VHFRCRERERPSDPDVVRRLAESADQLEQHPAPSPREEALRACLEELPTSSRRLIVLRYDGRDSHDLSRRFGRSVQGIYAQVKRIKQTLRAGVERRLAEA